MKKKEKIFLLKGQIRNIINSKNIYKNIYKMYFWNVFLNCISVYRIYKKIKLNIGKKTVKCY